MTTMPIRTETRFQCPACQTVGFFGTFTYHASMGQRPESVYYGKGYQQGDLIGHCNAHQHTGNGCTHQWVRNPESDASHFIEVPLNLG